MTESWFERAEDSLRHDMQRAVSRFHHEGHSITAEHLQPQEPAMALADTSAALQASHASALAELEDMLAKGHDVVDNHMTQIGAAIRDVAAVASIADNPLVAAAANALHVPPEVLDGFTKGLTALAAAFPKPQPALEQPEQPQQAEQAA